MPTARAIEGFHQDEEADWIADLECGHTQHVRHEPPLVERNWVTTEAGRSSMLGSTLDCLFCDMPQLPSDARKVSQAVLTSSAKLTAEIDLFRKAHPGGWVQLEVGDDGRLRIELQEQAWVIRKGMPAVVPLSVEFALVPLGTERMTLTCYRAT